MANRHLSRSLVMQTLFEWDFKGRTEDPKEILERNIKEFASDAGGFSFMRELLKNVLSREEDLNMIIEKAAPQWPIEKISIVDRNILRIGLYELLFSDRSEVPAKVAINESIEIAKKFGGEKSGKFVNGVLGAVYKEMGKTGVEETGKNKEKDFDIPEDEIEVEALSGVVVYSENNGETYLALVHDVFGYWTLSKDRIEKGETAEDAAKRGVKEEMGIDIEIEENIGRNEYISKHPKKKKIKKDAIYFLASAKYEELDLKETGGLDDAKWFNLPEIPDLKMYNDVAPIITKAVKIISKKDEK